MQKKKKQFPVFFVVIKEGFQPRIVIQNCMVFTEVEVNSAGYLPIHEEAR